MSAVALFHEDGKPAGVWYCSECRQVHTSWPSADGCHKPNCDCGKPLERPGYARQCRECDQREWAGKQRAAEAERFAKAEKIPAAEHDGPVFCEEQGAEYFESLEEFYEHYESWSAPRPTYVWATRNIGAQAVSLADVLEPVLEEMSEDADEDDLPGTPILAAAIEAFNALNQSVVVWTVDYSRAVVLDARLAA